MQTVNKHTCATHHMPHYTPPSASLSITRPHSAWFPDYSVMQRTVGKPAAVSLSAPEFVISRFVEPSKNEVPSKLYSYFSIPNGINSPRESGNNQHPEGHQRKGIC